MSSTGSTVKMGMGRLGLVALGLLLVMSAAWCGPVCAEELRLMTYNIRNCTGLTGREPVNVTPVAEVIKKQAPDAVALQEVDQNTHRNGNRNLPKELGESTGLKSFYAPACSYDGGQYGILMLMKKEPQAQGNIPLQSRFPELKEEHQTLQILEFPGYVLLHTHMARKERVRLEWVKIIDEEARKYDKPVFLLGDFNTWPSTKTFNELQEQGWSSLGPEDAKTYPANAPRRQIDFILVRNAPQLKVKRAEVINAPTESDHRPIVVEVEF